MQVSWRDGFVDKKVDAAEVHAEIETLRVRVKVLTPDDIVEAARDESSAMHRLFEWDDTVAAAEYRREQARGLIASIVVSHADEAPEREYVHLHSAGGYIPVREAMADPPQREEVLDRALAELEAFASRYRAFSRAAGLIEDVKIVVKKHRREKAA